MDRLAARGTLFSNAHCQSPLCNPSRASLLTGLRPSTTGIYGLAPGIRDVDRTRNCVTLPQYFARHGYFTAGFGKVFHDGSIPARLQHERVQRLGAGARHAAAAKRSLSTPPQTCGPWTGACIPKDDRDQADWKIADAAIAQMKSLPRKQALLPRRRVPPAARAVLRLAEVVRPASRPKTRSSFRR